MIDFNTAIFLWSGQGIALSLVLVSHWWHDRDARHSLYFGLGFLFYAFGITMVALHGTIPEALSISFASTVALLAFSFWGHGIRLFDGKPVTIFPLLPALVWTTACLFPLVRDTFAYRVVAFEIASMIGFSTLSMLLLMGGHSAWRCRLALVGIFMALSTTAALMGADALVHAAVDFTELAFFGTYSLVAIASFAAIILLFGKMMMDRTAAERSRLARIDPLTGALNRRGFEEEFEHMKADNPAALIAIVLFDIDHFKIVNDSYGHAAGDQALKQFTSLCRRLLPPGTPFGRTGGEEFAFALPQQDIRDATRHAEAIRREFAATRIEADQASIQVTTSAGVVTTPAQMATFDRSLTLADKALYLAKARGRNRVVAWNEDENAQAGEQARMIDDSTDRQVAVLQRITAVKDPRL